MALRSKLCANGFSVALSAASAMMTLAPAARAQVTPNVRSAPDADNAQNVRAPLFTYGVDAGIGESDNVTLVSTDKVSQTIATADADFTLKDQTRLLNVSATGDFSDLSYLQGAYGNEFLGRFDGAGNLTLLPGVLTWAARDDFGQTAVDAYTPVTPNNIENVNYFATGPDLTIRLGSINFLDVSARYARTQYQTSPFNSNRGLGSLALGREVSAGADVSLNAQYERVMFDNTTVNADFDRTSGFARYALHGARTDFEGDLGATTISQGSSAATTSEGSSATAVSQGNSATAVSRGSSSVKGVLAKLMLSRKLSAAAKLTVTAGRELTDASSSFSTLQTGGPGGFAGPGGIASSGILTTAPAPLTSDNYTDNYGSVEWEYVRNRTSLSASARWEQDSYPGQPLLDVKRPGADFSVQRRLTRAFTAQLLGRWYKTDYTNVSVASQAESSNYDDWLVGGSLIWRHGRGLEVRLRFDHDAHVVAAGGSGYAENRVYVTVGYRPSVEPTPEEPP